MEIKTLFVDEIVNNNYSITSNWNTIRYNLQTINTKTTNDFSEMMGSENQSTSIDIAGRFIYFITGSLDENEMAMSFIDCENNIDYAVSFCAAIFKDKQQFINMFMSRFTELKETYEKNKNQFKIKIGSPAQR